MKLMKKKKKGFTLIELIAVIAILAVLAVVAVPRVMTYVDKSKKSAVQTEATTIYNAAEAAYNDGNLYKSKNANDIDRINKKKEFNDAHVSGVVEYLKSKDLLSDNNSTKFINFPDLTLGQLKNIVSTDVSKLTVNSKGELTGIIDSNSQQYVPEQE